MNRKFFTLIAGFFMLAASLGTVSAQFGAGTAVDKFPKYPGEDNKLYQLTASETDDGTSQVFFLTVNADGVLDLDTVGALTPPAQFHATFGETLWCISFGTHVEGQNPKIDFTNKAHGLNLAVSADDAKSGKDFVNVKLGNLAGWGFSAAYKGDVEENKPLYTYADADNVLLLGIAERKSGDQTKDSLVVLKASAIDVVSKGVYPNGTLFFTIQEPAALWLTADQYNTILGTQKAGNVALKFDPEKANTLTVNPWSDQALFATPSSAGGAWLNFQIDKDEKTASGKGQTYVRVDTAYTNPTATGGGTQFLTFAYDTIVSNLNGYDLSGQYDFALRYYPSNDSIAIQVREVRYKPATGNWYAAANNDIKNNLFIKAQTLDESAPVVSRIITVGQTPLRTKISFGNLSCDGASASTDLTSIDNGLYVIYSYNADSTETYVLTVPIYTDSLANNNPVWVTLPQKVDPNYIPAYQWVAKKIRTNYPSVSPLELTNREFPNIKVANLQLTTKGGVLGGKNVSATKKGYGIVKVDAARAKDEYLGYFHITAEQASVNHYDLNYLHALSTDYFLGLSKITGDSSLILKREREQFDLVPQSEAVKYGYTASKDDTEKLGIAQLKRVSYVLNVNGKPVVLNKEKRYAISESPYKYSGDSAIFLLKTNNTDVIDGKVVQYYALLDTNTIKDGPNSNSIDPIGFTKVGIDDNSLWAYEQVQKETRTSAFAISEYSAPLYRRFDIDKYTYGAPGNATTTEKFGDAKNSPLYLKFFKTTNLKAGYLGESASKDKSDVRYGLNDTTISFLHLYNSYQFPEAEDKGFSYTFYVDTAYVNRPAVKGGTDITPKPQYLLALRPEYIGKDTVWYQTGSNIWYSKDEAGNWEYGTPETGELKSTVIESLTRGSYLFNAQDSVNVKNSDYQGKKEDNIENTTRLAFVDGIHRADTFYVLPKSYKVVIGEDGVKKSGVATRLIQIEPEKYLYSLAPENKIYLGDNDHFEPRFTYNAARKAPELLYVLDKNGKNTKALRNGKSMVFQFRLIPGIKGENEDRTFFIETTTDDGKQIGPNKAGFINLLNDVPVITYGAQFYDAENQYAAAAFNVTNEGIDLDNPKATSNEAVAESAVKVISEVGALNILNAAGKKVTVSNILGQTVAGATLASDNARIALPKGIVIVAVEGEAAVKAIVK